MINFQSCSFNSKGNLELIGQNVRFFLQHTSSQQGSVTWKIWQPYGYSFYELNTDLEIIKSDYEEAFYTNRTVRDGHRSILSQSSVKMHHPDIYSLVRNPESFRPSLTSITKSRSQGTQRDIIYKQLENSAVEYNYYYFVLSGNEKGKKVLLSKAIDDPKNQM